MFIPASLLSPTVTALCVLAILQFIFIVGINRRMTRQSRMLRQFFSGPQGEDLEMLLTRTLEGAKIAEETSLATDRQMKDLLSRFNGCVQHFALIRYDAFEDVTGQLSFSLAMLDGRDNGAIISTIYGRSNSRCFGKMIVAGQPEQPLTEEEQQALVQALEAKVGVKATPSTGRFTNASGDTTKSELVGVAR